MKKLSTIIIAIALILGTSQCKKNVETITPSILGEAIHITLNVGDSGKHIVYPGTGAYVFENGDKIYVGNNGHYIGFLTYGSGVFSGTIYGPSTSDYLHFYFVGGLTPSATPSAGSTTSFTVNIADQSGSLPVLSYGQSNVKYSSGSSTYSCTLRNKCGLVKFVPSAATSETVTVGGMKTVATVNFATPGITPTGVTGNVTLYSESNSAKWAILLPQDEVLNPTVTVSGYTVTVASVPAITNNMYYTNGVGMLMTTLPYIDANFTVASGRTVKFAAGNLQYQGSTDKFRFAEHQYDYVGNAAGNTAPSASQTAWIDLFGWGTSGYNSKYPYMTSLTNSNYGNGNSNISGTNYDWGVYNKQSNQNKIENGGDHAWRTLTKDEWVYLFKTRSNTAVNGTSNARFTKAAITTPSNGTVNGVIIFPDSYAGGTPAGVTWGTINDAVSGFTTTCTVAGWTALESAGCVFLPAAGSRYLTAVLDAGSYGYYWSSTCHSSSDFAYMVYVTSNFNPQDSNYRYFGCSVRLVF